MTVDKLWIPTGTPYGLRVLKDRMEDAGQFTGGGWKLVWHTTEGSSLQGAIDTLRARRSAPHFVIDPRTGRCVQTIPLNRAARCLQHIGPEETNRARAIQVEVVGFAAHSGEWPESHYRRLAMLALLIEHRVPIPRRMAAGLTFSNPRKLTGVGFVRAAGHLGHIHVPGNNHTDPGTGFRGALLRRLMEV